MQRTEGWKGVCTFVIEDVNSKEDDVVSVIEET
jgi:hypothetical protein